MLAVTAGVLTADEAKVFQCDFSSGVSPQVSAAPVTAYNAGAVITAADRGKAIRVGKKADGTLPRLVFRLKKRAAAGKTPFPLTAGRLTFRFRPVDWKIGSPAFNMLLSLNGSGKGRLHVIYLVPKVTGKPSLQLCYGAPGLPVQPQKVPALFPFVPVDSTQEWHEVEIIWNEASLSITVDGESQLVDTAALELPKDFVADNLLLGSYSANTLAGLTDIAEICIYAETAEESEK